MKIEDRFARLADPENWQPLPDSALGSPRGRSWRGPTLAVAATLVAAAGIAWSLAQPGHDSAERSRPVAEVVPWHPLKSQTGAIRLTAHTSAPPRCLAGNLAARVAPGGPAGGTYYVPLTLINRGSACTLDSGQLTVRAGATTAKTADGQAELIADKGVVKYLLATPNCVAKEQGGMLTPGPALDGEPLDTTGAVRAAVFDCSGQTSLIADRAPSPEDAGNGPYSALEASLDASSSIEPGSIVDFTVTLTNHSAEAFSFASCPDYTVLASTEEGNGPIGKTYTLDCAKHRDLPSGGSVTFAMRAQVPEGKGVVKVGWFLDNGPSVGVATNVGGQP